VTNSEIFRSKSSVIAAFIMYCIVLVMVFQTIFSSAFGDALLVAGIGGLIAYGFYLVLHRPRVEIGDEGIDIINPVWSYAIGWSDVQAIETRYTMSIQIADEIIYAWAAPAPGRYHSRKVHPSDIRGMDLADTKSIRFGESPRSDSGVAAHLARTRWKNFPDASREFRKVLNHRGLFIIALCTAISAIGLIVH
jgi:hypothetical protein